MPKSSRLLGLLRLTGRRGGNDKGGGHYARIMDLKRNIPLVCRNTEIETAGTAAFGAKQTLAIL